MADNIRELISKKLIELREEKNWTKTYVAERLGVTLSTYSNWEYAYRLPDIETIKEIAELYDVSVDYVLDLTNIRIPVKYLEDEHMQYNVKNAKLKLWVEELPVDELEALKAMWDVLKRNESE